MQKLEKLRLKYQELDTKATKLRAELLKTEVELSNAREEYRLFKKNITQTTLK
jgi:hypothetical protein